MNEAVQSGYRSQKDLGSFSGMVCLDLLVMVFVSIISGLCHYPLYVWTVWIGDMAEKQGM